MTNPNISIVEEFRRDTIRQKTAKDNQNFLNIKDAISDTTDGHEHNGTDSRKIDHDNLNDAGTLSHSQLEQDLSTAQGDISTHISDGDAHTSTEEKGVWDDAVAEIEDARYSTAKDTTFESIGARMDDLETTSAPDSHNGLTRNVPATGPENANQDHHADAIWDSTLEQDLQSTIDDLNSDKADKSSIIAQINASEEVVNISGSKVAGATSETAGTVKCSSDTAAPSDHTHTYNDDDIGAGIYHEVTNTGEPATVQMRWEELTRVNQPHNLLMNGTFIYAGYNNTTGLGGAIANSSHKMGIPGWRWSPLTVADHTDDPDWTLSCIRTLSDRPNLDWGFADDAYVQNWWGTSVLYAHSTDWSSIDHHYDMASYPFLASKDEQLSFIVYMRSASSGKNVVVLLQESDNAGAWQTVDTHAITGVGTTWAKYQCTFQTTRTGWSNAHSGLSRLVITLSANDMYFMNMGLFQGRVTSDTITPHAWLNPHVDPPSEMGWSIQNNLPPGVSSFGNNYLLFKKTLIEHIPVTSAHTGTLALTLPGAHAVYSIRGEASYLATIPVGTPPVTVPAQYFYWDQANSLSFTNRLTAINTYFPAPGISGTMRIICEYWPGEMQPDTWSV